MDSYKVKRIVSRTALFFLIIFILVFLAIIIGSYITEVERIEENSNANNTTVQPIDDLTISSINSRLLSYKGRNKGREVKRLIDKVNSVNRDFDLPYEIDCSLKANEVEDSFTYKVDFKYDSSGCISNVIIERD